MFEKVNKYHPDKLADRIAGALVDYCYSKEKNPRCAFEVLLGHGKCTINGECSILIPKEIYTNIVRRINGKELYIDFNVHNQDDHLSKNQENGIKCGDNGIFKGVPLSTIELSLSQIAREITDIFKFDGKYILGNNKLIICQSHAGKNEILDIVDKYNFEIIINPLGYWTGGINVDSGATNRKLGSDMGRAVTGGGLHGKDLSKADVSINIYAFIKAQSSQKEVNLMCAIGDDKVDDKPYEEIVEIARNFIEEKGGFEKFAEWGLF